MRDAKGDSGLAYASSSGGTTSRSSRNAGSSDAPVWATNASEFRNGGVAVNLRAVQSAILPVSVENLRRLFDSAIRQTLAKYSLPLVLPDWHSACLRQCESRFTRNLYVQRIMLNVGSNSAGLSGD
jgi:hypothetical protein